MTDNCNIRCRKAKNYRCRCSCNGISHASASSRAARRAAPNLSADIQPDSRSWLRAGRTRGIKPIRVEIPMQRQLDFSQIAAIWPDPEIIEEPISAR